MKVKGFGWSNGDQGARMKLDKYVAVATCKVDDLLEHLLSNPFG